MLKKYFISVFICCLALSAKSQQTSITIYPDSVLHPISPYIYGVNGNYSDESVKSIRQGGNRWTGYNWENGLSNAGSDYYNQSDSYLLTGIPASLQSQSGIVATYNHDIAKTYNQFFLTTIPAAGYVAATSGIATKAPSSCWNKVQFSKPSAYSKSPDLTDGVVYIDEYLNYLKTTQGLASKGGINAYSIDNEPELWNKTHPMLHPSILKMKELFSTTLSAATTIKGIDSTALVFGPAFANWYGMSSLNSNDNNWNQNIPKYGWFLALYLDSMKINSDKVGKRLVDVVDFHWYPEAQGDDNVKIVNTSGGTEPITQTAIKARLQAPRSLWDETYIEKSGLLSGQPLKVLKRIQASIDTWNPGTKIGITEYRYGREDHFSGGLALADALGVFGRQNVFCANKWYATGSTIFETFSQSAFDLYTNYDNNYSMFGNISIPTLNRSNDTISSFASIDKNNRLHIVTINKIAKTVTANMSLINGKYIYASVYGFDSANATIAQRDSIKTINNFNSCSYNLPAYSALHFIFEPLKMPAVVSAYTDTINDKLITILFSKSLKENILPTSALTLTGKSGLMPIDIAKIDSNRITLQLSNTIDLTDTSLYLSISDILTDTNNFIIKGLKDIKIANKLKGSTPELLRAELTNDGKTIMAVFSKNINSETNNFSISTSQSSFTPTSILISTDTLFLSLPQRLSIIDTIKGSYNSGSINFTDKSTITDIAEFAVSNFGPIKPLAITNTSILNSGFSIQLNTDNNISPLSQLKDFTITINGDTVNYTAILNSSTLTFNLDNKIEFGNTIVLSYKDNGQIRSLKGAYLTDFSQSLINTVSQEASRVTLPGRVEGENTYYKVGSMYTTANASSSNGNYLVIKPLDKIGYRIAVSKDTIFTLRFKYACADLMKIKVTISDSISSTIDTLIIARTANFAKFLDYGITRHLKKGNFIIEFSPISYQFNLDFIDFIEGIHIPPANLISTNIASNGQLISTEFNGFIASDPKVSNFRLTVDGTVLPIKSISVSNSTVLKFVLSDTIFHLQIVNLELVDSTITISNGGHLALFNQNISNGSMMIKTEVPIQSLYYITLLHQTQLSHNLPSSATIFIYNTLGVKIMEASAANQLISLDGITSGCYFFVAINHGETIYQNKFVLTK